MDGIIRDFLAAKAAKYEFVAHKEAPTSPEQAAAAHVSGWAWAKVVIVKSPEGLAMAVLPACCSIDLDQLKGLIGKGALELASLEDVLSATADCEPGAVPPFGALFGMPTYVDAALVNQREVTMPAGDHRTAIRMRADEFVRVARPRIGRFAVHESQGFPTRPGRQRRAAGAP